MRCRALALFYKYVTATATWLSVVKEKPDFENSNLEKEVFIGGSFVLLAETLFSKLQLAQVKITSCNTTNTTEENLDLTIKSHDTN